MLSRMSNSLNTAIQNESPNLDNPTSQRNSTWSLRSFEDLSYPEESILRVPLSDEERESLIVKDAKNKYLLESHIPAIVWTRTQDGFRVQDMTGRHYNDVSKLIAKYARLKRREEGKSKLVKDKTGKRMSMRRGSKRQSKGGRQSMKRSRQSRTGSRKSKTGGGSRKSMGFKKGGGSRKSMGPRSSKAGGGSRKSMGPRSSKAGRKSMSPRKSKGGRKSMGGRKSRVGKKSMGGWSVRKIQRQKGDWKVPRPVDIIVEEEKPLLQPAVFDDDDAEYPNESLQLIHSFKKKMSNRFKIWKLLKQKMYFRIYLVAVAATYRSYDIEKALFISLHSMCNAFNIKAIAGILTTYNSQNAFYSIGGLIVYEVLYKNYERFLLTDPKSYNQSAAIMFLDLTDPSNFPLVTTSASS